MSLTFVQTTQASVVTGTTISKAYGSNTASGSYLIAYILLNPAGVTPTTVTDTLLNTWVKIGSGSTGSSNVYLYRVAINKTGGGANTVLVSTTGGTIASGILGIAEYTGQTAVPPFEDAISLGTVVTSTSYTGAQIAAVFTNETILGLGIDISAGTITGTNGFTARSGTSPNNFGLVDLAASTTGNYTPGATGSSGTWQFFSAGLISSTSSPSMTQLVTDPFTSYGPSYPVNLTTGNWSKFFGSSNPVEVSSSGVATASVGGVASCGATWTGAVVQTGDSWPADQYAEITLGTVTTGGFFDCFVRGSLVASTRCLLELNTTTTTQNLYIAVAGSLVATYTFTATPATTDVWRLSVTGSTFTVTQNSIVRLTQIDANVVSGSPGFGIADTTIITSGTITKFSAGANQAATPTFSPNGGTFGPAQTVTITSATTGGTIFYTTDGTTPTHSSSSISNGGTITVSSTSTVKAFVSVTDFGDSAVGSASFTINGAVANTTFSPVAGTYSSTQSVTLSNANSALSGFAMTYTTDGTTPVPGSHGTVYTVPISVSSTQTIKVIASATNYSNSLESDAAYTITTVWSPIDSRQAVKGFGPGPNTGVVDAQTNTIYSAQDPPFTGNSQTSDNAAIPPTDSRKAGAPVDSRKNVPVNSRVAPPFKS